MLPSGTAVREFRQSGCVLKETLLITNVPGPSRVCGGIAETAGVTVDVAEIRYARSEWRTGGAQRAALGCRWNQNVANSVVS